jgi:hypothetical protein
MVHWGEQAVFLSIDKGNMSVACWHPYFPVFRRISQNNWLPLIYTQLAELSDALFLTNSLPISL